MNIPDSGKATCPHCAVPNARTNIACHACGERLCDTNPLLINDGAERFWTPTTPDMGTTDPVIALARSRYRKVTAWLTQEDVILPLALVVVISALALPTFLILALIF